MNYKVKRSVTCHVLKFGQLHFGSAEVIDEKVVSCDRRRVLHLIFAAAAVIVVVQSVPVMSGDDLIGGECRTGLIGRSFHFSAASEPIGAGDRLTVVSQNAQRRVTVGVRAAAAAVGVRQWGQHASHAHARARIQIDIVVNGFGLSDHILPEIENGRSTFGDDGRDAQRR